MKIEMIEAGGKSIMVVADKAAVIRDEDTLIRCIKEMDADEQCRFTRERIKDKYLASYGNAAEKAVEVIFGSRRKENEEET